MSEEQEMIARISAQMRVKQTFFVPAWRIEQHPKAIGAILASATSLPTTVICTSIRALAIR